MTRLFGFLNDGGPFLTYPLLLLFIVVIALFVRGVMKKECFEKAKQLLIHIGWFAFAWGYLGRTFGLINAFDSVEAAGEFAPSMIAHGIKMALLNPLFGIFVFLLARLFIIILVSKQKKNAQADND